MRITSALATGLTAAALAVPAGALADPGNGHGNANANGHRAKPTASTTYHDPTPGPKASAKAKAKAYGKRCHGQSKKHVKGQKGTPFSRCVVAAAKLRGKHKGGDEQYTDPLG